MRCLLGLFILIPLSLAADQTVHRISDQEVWFRPGDVMERASVPIDPMQ